MPRRQMALKASVTGASSADTLSSASSHRRRTKTASHRLFTERGQKHQEQNTSAGRQGRRVQLGLRAHVSKAQHKAAAAADRLLVCAVATRGE